MDMRVMYHIPTGLSPDVSDTQFVWMIFPSGFVNHNLDYTISYSYGLWNRFSVHDVRRWCVLCLPGWRRLQRRLRHHQFLRA